MSAAASKVRVAAVTNACLAPPRLAALRRAWWCWLPHVSKRFGSSCPQVLVKTLDMPEELEKDTIELGIFAMNEFNREVDMAAHIKRELDKKYRYSK